MRVVHRFLVQVRVARPFCSISSNPVNPGRLIRFLPCLVGRIRPSFLLFCGFGPNPNIGKTRFKFFAVFFVPSRLCPFLSSIPECYWLSRVDPFFRRVSFVFRSFVDRCSSTWCNGNKLRLDLGFLLLRRLIHYSVGMECFSWTDSPWWYKIYARQLLPLRIALLFFFVSIGDRIIAFARARVINNMMLMKSKE